ncbi:MAG TPA: Amuc_1100 family pilus-like protein [Opitutus sp.]|nr:Amuc_1100 family pilus-like protein [Opitutus sp.]
MATAKHPWFTSALAALAVIVAAEGWFIHAQRQAAAKAQRQLEAKRRELQAVAAVQPAPTSEVAAAIEGDLQRTTRALAAMEAGLAGTGPAAGVLAQAAVPKAPADAFFDIATFVERERARAQAAGVAVKPDERFGFAEFANKGPEVAQIPAVFRERLIVEHMLDALFAARPQRLLAVTRERPEAKNGNDPAAHAPGNTAAGRAADYFEIDPRVSARVPGFVQATAFRLTFTGQTAALRTFLNTLAGFELPLVVRAVEVTPEAVENAGGRDGGNGVDVPPLVARSVSRFAVTVEFIELVPGKETS